MTKENKLILFGAGGHAKKIVEIAISCNYSFQGYLSQDEPGTLINGYTVLGYLDVYNKSNELRKSFYHLAIGSSAKRYNLLKAINSEDNMVSLISPKAILHDNAIIGKGTSVHHNCVIHTNSVIGKCVVIDTSCIIEHDTVIGDFANIHPGAIICGKAILGNGVSIGSGAVIIEKVKIGDNSLIGAGTVITKDIEPNVLVMGNPARIIRKRDFFEEYLR